MKYFFEPINLRVWNIFIEICSFSYEESFYATKEMEIGDTVFFYVTKKNNRIPSGIYGNGIITKPPYTIDNGRYMADVKIKYLRFDEPIIEFDICKRFLTQFRSVHRIDNDIMVELMKTALSSIVN
ncbi:MAG: hypothetical protein FWH52_00880 [Synergistaceae bacterium]|nr:hypothetical protein [Synergistaceae bacterium]